MTSRTKTFGIAVLQSIWVMQDAFKGGQLMILAKKAFAAVECTHFRSILLASVPAKAYHRIVRRHLAPHLAAFKDELQAGSLPGTGTETLLLLARTMQDVGKAQQQRTCHLFFDIRSAFYMLLRQLVTDIGEEDETFLRLLHQMGVPQEALQELLQHLQAMAAVPAAGAGPHLSAITADLFRGSWFRLEGSSAVARTRRGPLSGDPTADVLYSFCLAALHKCMDAALEARKLLPEVPALHTAPLLPALPRTETLAVASWADDCLRFAASTTLPDLVQRVTNTLQVCLPWALNTPVGLRRRPFCSRTPRPARA